LEILGENGPALGIFAHADYPAGKASLLPGDLLVLYTDGVVEITNAEGIQFRPERLAHVLQRKRYPSAEEVIQEIVRETKAFSGMDSYLDDFTLVIIQTTS
jgi:sigma-B regulation protein RsbU (phosphoserine phosphatase)